MAGVDFDFDSVDLDELPPEPAGAGLESLGLVVDVGALESDDDGLEEVDSEGALFFSVAPFFSEDPVVSEEPFLSELPASADAADTRESFR